MDSTLLTLSRRREHWWGRYAKNMKERINTYFAILIIIIAGSGAAWIIIHVGTANTFFPVVGGSEASYGTLQKSILK